MPNRTPDSLQPLPPPPREPYPLRERARLIASALGFEPDNVAVVRLLECELLNASTYATAWANACNTARADSTTSINVEFERALSPQFGERSPDAG